MHSIDIQIHGDVNERSSWHNKRPHFELSLTLDAAKALAENILTISNCNKIEKIAITIDETQNFS